MVSPCAPQLDGLSVADMDSKELKLVAPNSDVKSPGAVVPKVPWEPGTGSVGGTFGSKGTAVLPPPLLIAGQPDPPV